MVRRALFQVTCGRESVWSLYVLFDERYPAASSSTAGSSPWRSRVSRRISAGPGARNPFDELKQTAKELILNTKRLGSTKRKNPGSAHERSLRETRRKKRVRPRIFNPYTGADLGDSLQTRFRFIPVGSRTLHDLLWGRTGPFD